MVLEASSCLYRNVLSSKPIINDRMAIGDLRTLVKAERELEKALEKVIFIGESRLFNSMYYVRLMLAARRTVRGQWDRVSLVPPRTLFVLMVLCARHHDISEHGFWDCFLKEIGLPNDQNSQAACRSRFKRARSLLNALHFPEGGYSCVTPVLYHAVIPQTCVPEMARFLRKLDHEVGWDAIAEMELQQLDFHLPGATSLAHATKPLVRFVSDVQSRRIAGGLVRDLCEAAYLHKIGEFHADEIELLLRDYPIQQEIWRQMQITEESLAGGFSLHSLFTSPRWQWDVKNRELRIYVPKQRVVGPLRPVALAAQEKLASVQACFTGDGWEVQPTYVSNTLINWSNKSRLKFGLIDEDGNWLRPWYIAPLSDRALFFRPNSSSTIGLQIDAERGLPAGECLVLLRQNLRLRDSLGDVHPMYRWHSPRGFEEYVGISVILNPPVSILNNEDEVLEVIPTALELRHSLHLTGPLLPIADDPGGIPAFVAEPPDLIITFKRQEEKQQIRIQCRALSDTDGPRLYQFDLDKLIDDGQACWSADKLEIRVRLSEVLPTGLSGRFRIKLLYGIQNAGYEPVEFFILPSVRLLPSEDELKTNLFTSDKAPLLEIICTECSALRSDNGKVQSLGNGRYQISWSYQETDFKAELCFEKFNLPLRWRPFVLRAGISSTNGMPLWSKAATVIPDVALTFSSELHVEAVPAVSYEIYVDGEKRQSGQFDNDGHLVFSLAAFSELVRSSRKFETAVSMKVFVDDEQYDLPLLRVLKEQNGKNGQNGGAMISRIPQGQAVIHPNYGLGVLEHFTEKRINNTSVPTAKFYFERYERVQFFIPISRRIPLYWR